MQERKFLARQNDAEVKQGCDACWIWKWSSPRDWGAFLGHSAQLVLSYGGYSVTL